MSKETAMTMATQNLPSPEVRVNPITGNIPENAKEMANPAVENNGIIPPSLHSTQLSHLAKKESKLIAEREAFKKEQEAFNDLKSKVQAIYDKAQTFESTRKSDPLKAMKELGFTEKEIVDYLSLEDAPKATTEEIVQAELKKFQEEQLKKQAEAQKANDDVLISKFKTQLNSIVASNPEKYELCAYHGAMAEDIMFEIAVEEAKEGKMPDVKSIAEDVEDFYYQQFESMRKLKKLSPREEAILQSSKTPERSRVVHPPQDIVKPKTTTLTNKIAPSVASLSKSISKTETREEKRARLENMLRGGLTR